MSRPNAKTRWRRRQKQEQAETFARIASETIRYGDDSSKLQRGSPSYTSTDTYAKHARLSGSRNRDEITPKAGKIVDGKFKANRGTFKPHRAPKAMPTLPDDGVSSAAERWRVEPSYDPEGSAERKAKGKA